ncbi:hypothetical protein [Endozoicomonas sp. ALC020]|uniref:hypothetical protein n=1 Tax=unclassified Endozoicomonas TaxID=2644528 RepID=UPI003BAF22CD
MLALDSRLRGNDDHILFPVFTPFTPSFTPVTPSITPVIPSFTPVIPAKAGIQTDSPPEPYCPVTPWPCHAGEVGDPMLALDSRLRGNDDHILFPVFTPVIPVFTPVIPFFTPVIPIFTPVIPSFTPVIPFFTPVIPAKAGIQTDSPPEPYCPVTPWPCHAGEVGDPMLALDSRLRGNDDHILFPVFTPVIPSFTPVIPSFTPVIPAKAGIQTDSPPEPYCPVTPWPCHAGEVGDPMLALDSRLRGNDDHILFPVFTPVTPSFTPVIPSFTPVIPSFTPVTPSFTPVTPSFTPVIPIFTPVIPAKAGIQTDSPPEPYCPVTPWPCHAGEVGDPMLALDSRLRGNDDHILFPVFTPVIPFFTPVIPSFTPVIPIFTPVIPAKAGIQTDSPPEPYCPVPPLALSSPSVPYRALQIELFSCLKVKQQNNFKQSLEREIDYGWPDW